jgi:hypothetical protein
MGARTSILVAGFLLTVGGATAAQGDPPQHNFRNTNNLPDLPSAEPDADRAALLERIVSNQKRNDQALRTYERIERLEIHKGADIAPPVIKVSRAVPAGTGFDHIPLGPDAKPTDGDAYRAELEKIVRALSWASENGHAQHEAYDKISKKQKERDDLIEATRTAMVFTFIKREPRGDRILSKYRMEPNPGYQPTSRATSMLSRIRGYLWIDPDAGQVARVEAEVIDDIAIGGILAKVYKGSHFMQERYPIADGVWLPSYSQYDFDGRKLFMGFAIHEHTYYSNYRHIGPPNEALRCIRAELDKLNAGNAAP